MSSVLDLDLRALDRARISRDPRFDGKFFIAVTSTRIYCRPVCPVRSPKKTNIRYYATAAAAAEAGYRPCLRCRPEAAPGSPAWVGTSALVRRALRLIEGGALDEISVEDLAANLGVGSRHLDRLFIQHIGASPITIALTRRLHFAKRLLDETNLPITDIAMAAGFGSLRRFNDMFQRTYCRSPRELRRVRRELSPQASEELVLKLAFRPPYNWTEVHGFLATRAIRGLEQAEENRYSRTIGTDDGHATISVSRIEGDALELRVKGAKPRALFQVSATVRRMFDLGADPARIARAFQADPLLGPIARQHRGLRIPGVASAFECTVRAVLGQQVSVLAARTFGARLVAHAGKRIAAGDNGLTHLFPTPEAIAASDLSHIGLTQARIATLKALARAVIESAVDFEDPADEVGAALVKVPGIGPWTAQYVALRGLGEPDAFPAGDLVLRRISGHGSSLTVRELEHLAESWRPWRGYAAQHLWQEAKDRDQRKHAPA